MECEIGTDAEAKRLVVAALTGRLTDVQSKALAALSPEVLSLALLAASKRIAEQDGRIAELESQLKVAALPDPATPSGQKPPYAKPRARKSRHKPGAKKGHAPARRKTPQRIDRHEDHRLEACPDCGGPLQRCTRSRPRKIEDILEDLRTEVVEHTIHRDYCPCCKKHVEPVVPDALPKAALGHRHHRQRLANLRPNRHTAGITRRNRCRWVKCYGLWLPRAANACPLGPAVASQATRPGCLVGLCCEYTARGAQCQKCQKGPSGGLLALLALCHLGPRKKTGQRKQTLPMGATVPADPTCRNGRKYLF